ncbi:phosphopantothenoylcysteine decarboxylase domain-containing protein [Alkalibacter mobilis]|uniref:phosphopantothenoylcysteine decarboxylase domain-containing protein n=1 Tax=Alkalibacter mobilis TaxID=2787712 RepID=UPI00189DE57C|nr:phosphopantothenoylcysteine decarboxylase [Alkalibacter mobilis]MBF7097544.1 hypothetical protein [Alkalibacter mobilis]
MIKVILTGGGTSENIDGVRKITNLSTGSLSSLIAEKLMDYGSKYDQNIKIYYVHAENCILPTMENNSSKIELITANTVFDVKEVTEKLLLHQKIDLFIHCMAISDFSMYGYLTMDDLARHIFDIKLYSQTACKKQIKNYFQDLNMQQNGKIPSNDDICVFMKRTPKIINLVKKISPGTFLVGFKLLQECSIEDLLAAANNQIRESGSDLVLANDANSIKNNRHEGILIDKIGNIIGTFETKERIANGIVEILSKKEII